MSLINSTAGRPFRKTKSYQNVCNINSLYKAMYIGIVRGARMAAQLAQMTSSLESSSPWAPYIYNALTHSNRYIGMNACITIQGHVYWYLEITFGEISP
jgi:hypothetical protein